MHSTLSWDASFTLVGIIVLFVGWSGSFRLNEPAKHLFNRAIFEPDQIHRPYFCVALQAFALMIGVFASFTILMLGTDVGGFVPERKTGYLIAACLVPLPVYFLGFLLLHKSAELRDVRGVERAFTRHVPVAGSSIVFTVATGLSYFLVYLAMDYGAAKRELIGWRLSIAVVLTWLMLYASVLSSTVCSNPILRSVAGTLCAVCSGCILFFLGMWGCEFDIPIELPSSRLYWRHYSYTCAVISATGVVLMTALVGASVVTKKQLQNTYSMGVIMGLSLVSALAFSSDTYTTVLGLGIPLGWACCTSIALAGIGEAVPFGLAAGFGYGLGPRLEEGFIGVGLGVMLMIGMQIVTHVTVVILLALGRDDSKHSSKEKED